jgi:hypothetical protein
MIPHCMQCTGWPGRRQGQPHHSGSQCKPWCQMRHTSRPRSRCTRLQGSCHRPLCQRRRPCTRRHQRQSSVRWCTPHSTSPGLRRGQLVRRCMSYTTWHPRDCRFQRHTHHRRMVLLGRSRCPPSPQGRWCTQWRPAASRIQPGTQHTQMRLGHRRRWCRPGSQCTTQRWQVSIARQRRTHKRYLGWSPGRPCQQHTQCTP